MKRQTLFAILVACALASAAAIAQQTPATAGFKIVVIKGEGAVNIIQQKTAVAPVIEVRDRNNLPVPGVSVTFSLGSGSASFGGATTLTATTNALGQATAAGFAPTAAGAVQINVTAAVQGQALTATITQANFATAAQAAQAGASAASGGGGGAGASTAGASAGAAGGGGLSLTTIGIIGGAVAGGAVAAQQTGLIGGDDGFIRILGTVYARAVFGAQQSACNGVFANTGGSSTTCYLEPVSGARASTTLDGATATSDISGNFDITTTIPRSRIEECVTYTLTITAPGLPTYSVSIHGFSGNRQGNEHRQLFSISPPSPEFMGSPGC